MPAESIPSEAFGDAAKCRRGRFEAPGAMHSCSSTGAPWGFPDPTKNSLGQLGLRRERIEGLLGIRREFPSSLVPVFQEIWAGPGAGSGLATPIALKSFFLILPDLFLQTQIFE